MNINRFKMRVLNVLKNSINIDDDNIKDILLEAIFKLANYAPIVGFASSQTNLVPALALSKTFFIPEINYMDLEHNIPIARGLENSLVYFAAAALTHSEKKQEYLEKKAVQMAQEYNWSVYNTLNEKQLNRFYDYDEKVLAIIDTNLNANTCFLNENKEFVFLPLFLLALDNYITTKIQNEEEMNLEFLSFWGIFCEYQEDNSNKKYFQTVVELDKLIVKIYQKETL